MFTDGFVFIFGFCFRCLATFTLCLFLHLTCSRTLLLSCLAPCLLSHLAIVKPCLLLHLFALAPCLAYYHTLPIFMPCCFHTLFVHALLAHALLSHLTALCLVLVPSFHALLSYSHTLLCYSCTLLLIVLVFVPCFYL